MIHILLQFREYRDLLSQCRNTYCKTGTLRGVYSLAGYLNESGSRSYVILLNQKTNYHNELLHILVNQFSDSKK